jgi:hypothetical protein
MDVFTIWIIPIIKRVLSIPSEVRSEDRTREGVRHKKPNTLGEVDKVLHWIMSIINWEENCFKEFHALFIELLVDMDDDKFRIT